MLEAQDIRVKRGESTLLDGVSVCFVPGKVSVIIGPNGAGKSTLLSCLAGLTMADNGAALLDGKNIADMEPRLRSRQIGFLPQNGEVHWDILARDLVALGRFAHHKSASATDDTAAIKSAMVAADCAQFAQRNVRSLSGGERARVMLARVLAGQPLWILADEPLANLDPRYQLQLLSQLRRMADDGAGVVAVLHDLTLAARAADYLVLMHKGSVFASGSAEDVLTQKNILTVFGINCTILRDENGAMVVIPVDGR
jgi:ABC-type cobalamin/Fe3+-siderophores transport system ATPase subunit